jgi:hypothetical protein
LLTLDLLFWLRFFGRRVSRGRLFSRGPLGRRDFSGNLRGRELGRRSGLLGARKLQRELRLGARGWIGVV